MTQTETRPQADDLLTLNELAEQELLRATAQRVLHAQLAPAEVAPATGQQADPENGGLARPGNWAAGSDSPATSDAGPCVALRLGSRVVGAAGSEPLGRVERVIIHARAQTVTHLQVVQGWAGRQRALVPLAAVGAITDHVVQLSAPLDGWRRALRGTPTASDSRDSAAVAVGRQTRVETGTGLVGTVERVLFDPTTGRITHLVARQGGVCAERRAVPTAWAAEIGAERVLLRADEAQLATLPEYRPDDEIAADVLNALRRYAPVRRGLHGIESYEPAGSRLPRGATVRLVVQGGVVTLLGHVQGSGHGSVAARLAGQIRGVRQVRNLLATEADLEIAVALALGQDPRTQAVRAGVASYLGSVTLRGRVPDEPAQRAAGDVAAGIHGVQRVTNRLRVDWPGAPAASAFGALPGVRRGAALIRHG